MNPFDDNFFYEEDPFESIFRDFFGAKIKKQKTDTIIKGEEEDRNIDFIEDENHIYLVFELLGYNEKDISIIIKGKELEIKTFKKEEICSSEKIQNYLTEKLCRGIFIKKILPKFINPKNFKYTMKNGILEVVFNKK